MFDPTEPAIDADAFEKLTKEGPYALPDEFAYTTESIGVGAARIRLEPHESFLRYGGTISGPTLFTLADLTLFAAVLSLIGPETMAVTTEMATHFLRKAGPKPLIADGRILRAGRRLIYGDVTIYVEGDERPICHATGTYARP